MKRYTYVAMSLVQMLLKTRLEYRGATFLSWFSMAMAYASIYAAIGLIVLRFGTLGGWQWPEMALLLSFHLFAYSVGASLSFTQLRELEVLVRHGRFDAILVKPVGPWTYLVFSGLNIGYVGHITVALSLMIWSLTQLHHGLSPGAAVYLFAAGISAAMMVCAIMTMIGAQALVWVKSRYLYAIFFGFWELARYPLLIFPVPIQVILLSAAPLGFLAYVPVAVALGKDVVILGPFAGPASLLIGPLAVGIAMLHWRHCLRNYQGAGG